MTFEVLGEITFHWRRLGAAGRPVVLQRRTHLEVTAPIIEAQLVETFIINQINLQSLIATKAARCVHAAGKRAVVDFALRRTMESMPG